MADRLIRIRPATHEDIQVLAELIAEAYRDVAQRFNLTPENCAKHPSNYTPDWVANDMARGVKYFILEFDCTSAGCVALEIPRPGECYLKRLAVLPAHRHKGYGAKLVQRIITEARTCGVQSVGIGIIGAQLELKQWYQRLGFKEGETRTFDHLPFEVTFMARQLKAGLSSNE